jgi:drug/metabolite transporter (DMT)-like permease
LVGPSLARRRLLAYAGLYFFWGTTFLGVRVAVRSLPPFLLSGMRHASAGLLFLLYARVRGVAWPSWRQGLGAAAIGAGFLAAGNGACTWALQHVESGYATLMIGGVPILALAYSAIVHGRRVPGKEWALVLLGLLGVGILLSPRAFAEHSDGAAGILALCFGVLAWAATLAEKRRIPQPGDIWMSTSLQMLGGGSLLLLVSACVEHPWTLDLAAVPALAWGAWAYLVLFGSCVGYGAFSWLLTVDTPSMVGTYAFVNPVVAILAGHWLLGEAWGPVVLLSGVLVICSVAGLLRMERDDHGDLD